MASDLFDAARLPSRQIDTELFRGAEDLIVGVAHLQGHAVAREHLNVEAQRLHLLDEHLERLGDAGLGNVLALDDRLVDLDPAEYVVGLDGEQLLQRVSRAVSLERPHFHLTEPLTAELCLTAQRLLGDHRVRTGRARVELVVDEVVQLQDVDVSDADRLGVELAASPVPQPRLAVLAYRALPVGVRQGRAEQTGDLVFTSTVEDRRRDEGVRRSLERADVGEPLLPAILAGGVDLPAALRRPTKVRLEDLSDVHAARHAERVEHDVDRGAVFEERHVLLREDLGNDALVAVPAGQLVAVGDLALLRDVDPHQFVDAGRQLSVVAGEDLDVDDLARLTVRHLQRGVANLAGLLPEDRAQQPLFGGELGLALGRDLADQDVAGDDVGADADDAPLVEVGENFLADVRDVAGDLFRTKLGVARVDFVLLDVSRREHVVLHQTLAEDDRVFVVVALPWHERHEQVAAKSHLALVGARTVGDCRTGFDPLTLTDDRALVDAGALVGTTELRHAVGGAGAVVVHDGDRVGGNLVDDTVLGRRHDVARVDRGTELHASADERSFGLQQRHRLALHVGTHQRPVSVVVLQERNHRGRDRHHLAR